MKKAGSETKKIMMYVDRNGKPVFLNETPILARGVLESTKYSAPNPESAHRHQFTYTSPGTDPRKTPDFVL